MAFLDIERIINQKNVDSRFKLVHLAALRARELNNPDETTVLADLKSSEKVTSKALTDIVRNKVKFVEIEDISEEMVERHLYTKGQPDPDVVIRTSGQIRTSGFLPWQTIYSEFVFMEKNWPDFKEEDLLEAIKEYQNRTIKKGK